MRVILADDERLALDVLERLLGVHGDVDIVGLYTDPALLLEEFEEKKPDVAFLDIEMGSTSGLELGNELLSRCNRLEIVFVTAYAHYAIEAFDLNAIDYLLKPVRPKRLAETIARLQQSIRTLPDPAAEDDVGKADERLYIRSFGGFEVLSPSGQPIEWRTQKTRELMAYLWFFGGQPMDKAQIVEALFSDKSHEQGRTLLHTTVYQLRRSLSSAGFPNGVQYRNDRYWLDIPFESDVDALASIAEKPQLTEDDVRKVLELYRGEFLQEGYPWLGHEQFRYNLDIYRALAGYLEQNGSANPEILESVLRLLYEMDPFSDATASIVIRTLGEQGRRRALEFFYRHYADSLMKEIGVEPSKECKTLYEKYMVFDRKP